MSHDHAFGSALIVFALLLWAILTIRHERHADRSRLPGALQGDDPSQPWEGEPAFDLWGDFDDAEVNAAARFTDVEHWLRDRGEQS